MPRHPDLPPVIVTAEHRSPRLEVALEWTFTSVLGLGWKLVGEEDFGSVYSPWKLRYGGTSDGSAHRIEPHGLLSATDMLADPPDEQEGDLLALIFWMGSRMEEHVDAAIRDGHGRFDPTACPSKERGWIGRPVCEEWAFRLGSQVLGADWPAHEARLKKEYTIESTVDVDSAFAFRGKPMWRTATALGRDLMTGRWDRANRRVRACRGLEQDPYDTYDRILRLHDACGLKPRWFFLLSRFGSHDKGVGAESRQLRSLMHRLEERHPGSVQWHPGYAAAGDAGSLEWEFEAFREIMGRPPSASRQHYLRMVPGVTRRRLLDLGVREDHTEGHAALAGFRGGFSRPRPWYDLEREKITELMLCPFAAMDATLNRYMGLEPDAAATHVSTLADTVRTMGGAFRLLWHNETLVPDGDWKGWDSAYPNVLEVLSGNGVQAVPLD